MKNLKRVLSLMMAVLLCFGLFPGSALAAENDYDGYLAMIEYKDRRYSLSENLPAPFGGHTTEEFFELRINDLRTYRTAYCIQMGVPRSLTGHKSPHRAEFGFCACLLALLRRITLPFGNPV